MSTDKVKIKVEMFPMENILIGEILMGNFFPKMHDLCSSNGLEIFNIPNTKFLIPTKAH